jgi:hypothetical protein
MEGCTSNRVYLWRVLTSVRSSAIRLALCRRQVAAAAVLGLVVLLGVAEPFVASKSATAAQFTPTMWSYVAASQASAGLWACAGPETTSVHGNDVRIVVTMGGTTAVLTGSAPDASDLASEGFSHLEGTTFQLERGRTTFRGALAATGEPNSVVPSDKDVDIDLQQGFCLARFAAGSDPVLVDALYSGGAHCCSVIVVAVPGPQKRLTVLEHDFGNPPARLVDVRSQTLLVSGDNRFAYAFSGFAGSGFPILTMTVRGRVFVNVTRSHLELVAGDAADQWSWFDRDHADPYGVLAAWVADKCELGQGQGAWTELGRLATSDVLERGTEYMGVDWPNEWSYVRALKTFLGVTGYCPGPV